MDGGNERHDSEPPSTSSSDFYSTTEQPNTNLPPPAAITPEQQDVIGDDNNDQDADDECSSSEMDVSVSSRAASPTTPPQPSESLGAKRKLSDADGFSNGAPQTHGLDAKKRKLSPSLPLTPYNDPVQPLGLPVHLWQQVFLHLPPAMLCRCLRVCRRFNDYLTKTKASALPSKGKSKVRIVDSEAIWSHARKVFFPSLPRPLQRFTELEMLQLIGGQTCQFCARVPVPSTATTSFNSGPGYDGLRVIWPFGVRTCGKCLEENSIKDVHLLQSKAGNLRFGLPHAYLTPDLHYVPEIQRQQPGGIPSHLRVSKVYNLQDVHRIVSELKDVESLGAGATDEWRKGLRDRGNDEMKNAARWEQWEASMQLGSDLPRVLRKYDLSSFPGAFGQTPGKSYGAGVVLGVQPQPVMMANGSGVLPQHNQYFQNGYAVPYPMPGAQYQQAYRPVRDPHEVEAIRQARKSEIERRCLELEPPLEPNVLQHIEAFQAAMQITAPMTDSAWEMLRPRILGQREAAELAEHQRQEQWAALQSAVSDPTDMDFIKPAKEIYDKAYEHAQEPLRKRLGEYFQEYTDLQWNGAHHLDKDNTPAFAVGAMMHVHQRYLNDKEDGSTTAGDRSLRTESKQSTPATEPFLSLDNMKWLYDNKIRPLTDKHRRELFICAGCAEERKPKWFAFEGLIQHYGAKHTTAFSKGNIIVRWPESDWPDEPPFHQDPSHFIRADKKANESKSRGRVRNTPSVSQDLPFAAPGSSQLLSENPLFSGGARHGSAGPTGSRYTPSGYHQYYGHTSPLAASHGYPYVSSIPAEPTMDMSELAQGNKLSNDAREIWDALDGVKDLPVCVRVQAAIEHAVTRFRDRFGFQPTLDLLTDALATKDQIKPLKNASGLACQICVAEQTDGSANYQSYYARIRNVKLYNAAALITHFKIVHQARENAAYLDWTRHMIEMPEQQLISDMTHAPGMDDDKLAIIASAFPRAFPAVLPKIGSIPEAAQETGPESGVASRLLDRMNKKPKQQAKKKGQHGTNGTSTPGRDGSAEPPLPEPKEDEYDPRRPLDPFFTNKNNDPARFDTDIARQVASTASPMNPGTFNLAPDTIAALNNLNALALQSPSQYLPGDGRGDRSPSVGRDDSKDCAIKQEGSTSKIAPDISAILASLTGQIQPAQVGTPPATVSNRSDSTSTYPSLDNYGQPSKGQATSYSYQQQRTPVPQTAQQGYRGPTPTRHSPRYENEITSATGYNSSSFQHNQSQPRVEPIYAQPIHAQPAFVQAHSPPQYQYHYDPSNQWDSRPAQTAPAYREQQAVQYVQLSPQQHYAPVQSTTYHHHRSTSDHHTAPPPSAPPQSYPVYVDERGRQLKLIPIDSEPAPVQYLPHPFEQQQQQQQQRQQQYYASPQHPPQPRSPGPAAGQAAPHPRPAVYYSYPAQSPPGGHHQQHGGSGMY